MSQSSPADLFQPLRPQRSSQRVADRLWRAIVSGQFRPGELLPPERTLAERFQVTRNTIREATRNLEQLGLVSIRQGSGVTVLDYLATAGVEFLAALVSAEALGGDLMRDVWEARVVLGTAMMSYAVERFDTQQTEVLAAAVEAFAEQAHRPDARTGRLQDLEFEVHGVLLRGAGNRALAFLHNSLRRTYQPQAHLFEPIMADPVRLAAAYRRGLALLKKGKRPAATKAFCASLVIPDEGGRRKTGDADRDRGRADRRKRGTR